MTDMIDELRRYASLWANDPTVPNGWRETNAPEVTWGELDGVAGMCYRAADALTSERSQREAAERERDELRKDVAFHAECRPNRREAEALRAERDTLSAALAECRAEKDRAAVTATLRAVGDAGTMQRLASQATAARKALIIAALRQRIDDCERDGLCEPAHVQGLEEAIEVVLALTESHP